MAGGKRQRGETRAAKSQAADAAKRPEKTANSQPAKSTAAKHAAPKSKQEGRGRGKSATNKNEDVELEADDVIEEGDVEKTREGKGKKRAAVAPPPPPEDEEDNGIFDGEVVDESDGDCEGADGDSSSDESEEVDGERNGMLVLEGAMNEDDLSSDSDNDDGDGDSGAGKGAAGAVAAKGKGKGKAKGASAATAAKKKGSGRAASVQVDFDFCDPAERFFHGIKALLAPLLPPKLALADAAAATKDSIGGGKSGGGGGKSGGGGNSGGDGGNSGGGVRSCGGGMAAAAEITDLVVAQASVGTVVTCDDGDDSVFAFSTALPVHFHAEKNTAVAALEAMLLAAAAASGGAEKRTALEALLGAEARHRGRRVGLLLHGRMVNLPLPVVPKLYEALGEDITWAVENEVHDRNLRNAAETAPLCIFEAETISQEHKDKFKFDSYILLAPAEAACSSGGGSSAKAAKAAEAAGGKKPKAAAAAAAAAVPQPTASELFYARFEDEILVGEADFWFAIPVRVADSGGGGSHYLVVAALPADALRRCVPQIEQLVGGI